jgi:hypothetical protein
MIPRPAYDPLTHEFCTHCKEVKPHREFPRTQGPYAAKRSGLHGWCTSCNNEASAKWEQDHKARRRAYQALYARRSSDKPPEHWQDRPIRSQGRLFSLNAVGRLDDIGPDPIWPNRSYRRVETEAESA